MTKKISHHSSLPIRGSSSKPKGYMLGDIVQNTPEQVQGSRPNQATPSNIAQAPLPIVDLTDDQKAWDTIIVCSLLSAPFKAPMSTAQIAKVINVSKKRTDRPIGPETVTHMLEIADWPHRRKKYPETCEWEKWEGVRDQLAGRNGVRDDNDKDERKAYSIFSEAVRDLALVEVCSIDTARRCSNS